VNWHSIEVAPGITRIESVLGPRPFSQYLLQDHRSLLVDTGVKEPPADVILPAASFAEKVGTFTNTERRRAGHHGDRSGTGNRALRLGDPGRPIAVLRRPAVVYAASGNLGGDLRRSPGLPRPITVGIGPDRRQTASIAAGIGVVEIPVYSLILNIPGPNDAVDTVIESLVKERNRPGPAAGGICPPAAVC